MDQERSFPSDEEAAKDIGLCIQDAIRNDYRDQFVTLVNRLVEKENSDNINAKFWLSEFFVWICHYHAVHCAAALVQETKFHVVDLNVALEDGLFPLHHAAQSLSSNLTSVFLRNGALTDVRCDDVGTKYYGLLPLHIAVESLSYCIEWTPKQSIIKLILTLCQMEMKDALVTISLLASKTEEVKDVIYHYAEEGKLIELAALLMVSLDSILPSFSDVYLTKEERGESSLLDEKRTLRQSVAAEIALLMNQEFKLMGSGSRKLAQICKERKRKMMFVMQLLEIFEREGHIIQLCLDLHNECDVGPDHLVEDIARILQDSGFCLKDEDIRDFKKKDCRTKLELVDSDDDLVEFGDCRPQHLSFYSQSHNFSNTKRPIQQQRPISTLAFLDKPSSCFAVRSFHMTRSLKASVGSKFCVTMEAQVKKTAKAIKQHVPNSVSTRRWSSFALAIKRGIRYV